MAQPTVPPAAAPAGEEDIALKQLEPQLAVPQAPAGAPAPLQQAMGTQRIDLQALLADESVVEQISDAAEATRLGIEARGQGNYKLAEKLYLHSMKLDDGAANSIANWANLADIARLKGDFRAAHNLTDTGLNRVMDYATEHSIDLSTDGVGFDADPEQTAERKAFWFALAKVFNFKALTKRAEFDASGVGDKRNAELLEESLQGNQRSFDISTKIGHGYLKKVLVDLLADKLESDDPKEWQSAIDTVTPLLETGGLDPNRAHNFHSICGKAYMKLGQYTKAAEYFTKAFDVSEKAGLEREMANDYVGRMYATMKAFGWTKVMHQTNAYELLTSLADHYLRNLTESDIGSQQEALRAIHAIYPLPDKFIRRTEETA